MAGLIAEPIEVRKHAFEFFATLVMKLLVSEMAHHELVKCQLVHYRTQVRSLLVLKRVSLAFSRTIVGWESECTSLAVLDFFVLWRVSLRRISVKIVPINAQR